MNVKDSKCVSKLVPVQRAGACDILLLEEVDKVLSSVLQVLVDFLKHDISLCSVSKAFIM